MGACGDGAPAAAAFGAWRNNATQAATAAGARNDQRQAPAASSSGPKIAPLTTMATPMPAHASEPATARRCGCVAANTITNIEKIPKPADKPATAAAKPAKPKAATKPAPKSNTTGEAKPAADQKTAAAPRS